MEGRPQIAVVGATGVVGQEILSALLERGFPADRLTLLGTERSENTEVEYGEETLEVEKATTDSFRGMAAVLLATPKDASRLLAQAAQAAGAWVVDASSAFRGEADVPLMLPAVGATTRPARGRIVRVPSALTTLLAFALDPLRRRYGLRQVEATALLAVSSAGQRGVQELEKQAAALLSGRESEPELFPHRIGYNLIPQVGPLSQAGISEEEEGAQLDVRALWPADARNVPFAVTAVQVPTFFGHAVSLSVRLAEQPSEAEVRQALREENVLKVLDAPEERIYPMPMTVTADPAVHVGRIRKSADAPEWVRLYAVIDNAGRGAALNVLEAAESLLGGALEDDDEE